MTGRYQCREAADMPQGSRVEPFAEPTSDGRGKMPDVPAPRGGSRKRVRNVDPFHIRHVAGNNLQLTNMAEQHESGQGRA